jgi:hypothetical protein
MRHNHIHIERDHHGKRPLLLCAQEVPNLPKKHRQTGGEQELDRPLQRMVAEEKLRLELSPDPADPELRSERTSLSELFRKL